MPGAITATTTATATESLLKMSLLSSIQIDSLEPTSDSPVEMPTYTPGQCLFCTKSYKDFDDSVTHMQKAHGLFVPHPQHLAVDLETLFKYLHLVIFGYHECIHCGTERSTVQAVQQHMTGKGHCRFDVAEPDSEFAEFYDFSDHSEDVTESSEEEGADEEEEAEDKPRAASPSTSPNVKAVRVDGDSIRLPSGKIISKHTSAQAGPSFTQLKRRTKTRALPSRLEYTVTTEDEEAAPADGPTDTGAQDTRALSKREKRERAAVTYQMANMSASDRNALVHLPASEQRALMAAQFRSADSAQKKERRRQGKVDRKGNKNLYAYWHTETPVYQCG